MGGDVRGGTAQAFVKTQEDLLGAHARPVSGQVLDRQVRVAPTGDGFTTSLSKAIRSTSRLPIVSSVGLPIDGVFPRDHIYSVAAPQSFRLGEILALYRQAEAEGDFDTRDSCTLMNRYGRKLHRVDGPRWNIKVTTAEDFYLCRTFFEIIENRQIAGA